LRFPSSAHEVLKMKKIFLLFFGFSLSASVYADVIIFNMSEKNSIEITYRICDVNFKTVEQKCNENYNSIVINAVNDNASKNYVVISPTIPNLEENHLERMEIISAVEKDGSDKILAQTNYKINEEPGGTQCFGLIAITHQGYSHLKRVIILNDMKQSPYILCDFSSWNIGI